MYTSESVVESGALLLSFRLSVGLFSWLDERQSESRTAIDAKKAQWRRELGNTHKSSNFSERWSDVYLPF